MTYPEYINKLNVLYTKRQLSIFNLVDTKKEGTYPFTEIYYDHDDSITKVNVADEVAAIDKEIFELVLAASEEPWYQMHCSRHTQTYEILTHGVPSGMLTEKPKHDFKGFTF